MLEKILESNGRTRVAAFFLANPPRAFYVGEVRTRLGGKSPAPELRQLVALGFLTTFSKKGKRYYAVNKKFNGYRELRDSVATAARRYEDELFRQIRALHGVSYAVLTGLFTGYPSFECDILLVGNPKGSAAIERFAAGLNSLMGQEVNYAIMPPGEFRYRSNTFDRFIKDIFENRHIVVVDSAKTK